MIDIEYLLCKMVIIAMKKNQVEKDGKWKKSLRSQYFKDLKEMGDQTGKISEGRTDQRKIKIRAQALFCSFPGMFPEAAS